MEKSEDDEVNVIEAEKVEGEPEDTAEAEDKEKAETGEEKPEEKTEAEPPAPKAKKSGLSMAGLIVTVLGAVGTVGAFLLDPILNMTDSSHPAGISIGNIQMMVIGVAAVVLIVGIVIIVLPRKKPSSG